MHNEPDIIKTETKQKRRPTTCLVDQIGWPFNFVDRVLIYTIVNKLENMYGLDQPGPKVAIVQMWQLVEVQLYGPLNAGLS